jgi:hypothetical protein
MSGGQLAFAIFILAPLLGLIPASIASSKGREFLPWWLYGWALFIAALPHALMMQPAGKKRRCEHCAETIRVEAKVCPHCQKDVAAPAKRKYAYAR